MPLPVAHSLVGLTVAIAFLPKQSLTKNWRILIFAALLAIIPDFDFYFVWILNLGSDWHRSFLHSFAFAVVVTFLIAALTKFKKIKIALICGAALLSHGMLDFLTTRQASGIELFYPFWDERLKLGIFGPFEFDHENLTSWLKFISIEFITFGSLLLLVLWIKGYLSSAIENK